MTKSILEAQRKAGYGMFRQDDELEAVVTSVTASKATMEIVDVEIAPSIMFDVFVDSWFDQMDRIFRGPNFHARPILVRDSEGKEDNEAEREMYLRYLETLFWRKMVSIHPEYCKTQEQKNLKAEMRRNIVTPGLFGNAVAVLGTVAVTNLGIRLEPKYIDTYDYKSRILSKDEFIEVVSWLQELRDWGFVGFDGFNSDPEGSLDFMLMTAAEDVITDSKTFDLYTDEDKAEEDADDAQKSSNSKPVYCRFVIKSQKASSNIVALYRYFFYNERIKYISDYRNAYTYSTFDDNADTVRYIVRKMIYENCVPTFLETSNKRTRKSGSENETAVGETDKPDAQS